MTLAETVVERIEIAGGKLALSGPNISFQLPEDAADLLDDLRANKDAVVQLLRKRGEIPTMPTGVQLVSWRPKPAPVILTRFAVVTDVSKFVSITLSELEASLAGKPWLSGHLSVDELVERLEQCGVFVKIDEAQHAAR